MYIVPALAGLFANYVGLLALAVFLLMTYLMWKSIEGPGARTTPGRALLYQLIPGYGIYWMFKVYPGFATDFNNRASLIEAVAEKPAPRLSRGLMSTRCWLFMLTIATSRAANNSVAQQGGQWAFWLTVLIIGVAAIIVDSIVISKVCDAVNWLADASLAPASESATSTSVSAVSGAAPADSPVKHTKLGIASSILSLLMLVTFVVMLASRDPARGAGVDLSWATLLTLNGASTLFTVLLGVAAAVLAIAAFGRRNTRKVFAAVGLGGSLMFLTVTAALMMSAESGLANWGETTPKSQKPANYSRLFPIVENGKWGFIDVNGRVLIGPQYDYANRFSEGLAAVNVGGICKDGHATGGQWGFIDTTGTFVINPQYDWASDYADGLAYVSMNTGPHCAFLDTHGDTVIAISPNPLLAFVGGRRSHGVVGVAQTLEFSQGYVPFAPGADNPKAPMGFLDRSGRVAVAAEFADVRAFSERLAAVQVGSRPTGKWGYVNSRGRWVIRPQFDNAGPFSEGLADVEVGATYSDTALERNGKWGYVDRRGKLVVSPRYDGAGGFSEGLAAVQVGGTWDSVARRPRGGKWGFIDRHGSFAIQPQYDWAGAFANGRSAVKVAGLEGYIDAEGAFVVQPQYYFALDYCDGLAIVVAASEPRIPLPHLLAKLLEFGFRPTPERPPDCGPWAYIDTAGRFVWKSADWPSRASPDMSRTKLGD